ncbi:MAG: DUF4920 domain-containing protein [Bacteroidetes bacterium]|nr:DUF4920 domain-containing protein [Bacteroidota bacterium]
MKNNIIAIAGLLMFASCSTSKKSQDSTNLSSYGPTKVNVAEAMTVKTMLSDFQKNNGQDTWYTFEAPLNQVCAKAGCWVNVDKGNGETFMVRFKDHFTIPTTTPVGTQAIFHGLAYQDTVSVDMLRHFAEDAGESEEEIKKIVNPKITMSFEADGVSLRK